jgi:WD40 repeat protein
MYDLKTSTRLYVLEGHAKPITACSFSTDGRRLVTISLGESLVLVWKVGSSFSSFFNPGAPPNQGHGGSQPFKTLNFNVGTDGKLVPLFLVIKEACVQYTISPFFRKHDDCRNIGFDSRGMDR